MGGVGNESEIQGNVECRIRWTTNRVVYKPLRFVGIYLHSQIYIHRGKHFVGSDITTGGFMAGTNDKNAPAKLSSILCCWTLD